MVGGWVVGTAGGTAGGSVELSATVVQKLGYEMSGSRSTAPVIEIRTKKLKHWNSAAVNDK